MLERKAEMKDKSEVLEAVLKEAVDLKIDLGSLEKMRRRKRKYRKKKKNLIKKKIF